MIKFSCTCDRLRWACPISLFCCVLYCAMMAVQRSMSEEKIAHFLKSEDFLGRAKEMCSNEAILKLLDGEQVPLFDRRWRY